MQMTYRSNQQIGDFPIRHRNHIPEHPEVRSAISGGTMAGSTLIRENPGMNHSKHTLDKRRRLKTIQERDRKQQTRISDRITRSTNECLMADSHLSVVPVLVVAGR